MAINDRRQSDEELQRQVEEATELLRKGLNQDGHSAEQHAQAAYRFLSAHYLARIALAIEGLKPS